MSGEAATVTALVQLLEWAGGKSPASSVGYIYQQALEALKFTPKRLFFHLFPSFS